MKIERLVMVECNLLALALRVLRRRFFGFAITVRGTTAFRARPHEILFARNATAPNKGCQQQQT